MKDIKDDFEDAEVCADIHMDGTVDTDMDKEPVQLPPIEDVIINLGFWLNMLQQVAPKVLNQKLCGMSKPLDNSQSQV